MPKRITWSRLELCTVEQRLAMGDVGQLHWYKHFAPLAAGRRVLDVGAGTGRGFREHLLPVCAYGEAIDPLPLSSIVQAKSVEEYADKSFDVLYAMDVLEHVEQYEQFFRHLARVATSAIVITTPNWNYSKAANPFHYQEFTPEELAAFLSSYKCRWVSCDDGLVARETTDVSTMLSRMAVVVSV